MIAKTGSQSILCSMPFRYDTYRGCTHGCLYCFATKANKKFKTKEEYYNNVEDGSVKDLENFLKNQTLDPYLKGTPIHWGGMSDGFQPVEEQRRLSYQSLLLFAKYQYPVVISTKGIPIITSDEYIDVLKKCKVVVQVSVMSKETETWDRGTVNYEERLKGIKKLLANGIRVVIRNQPYMVHYHSQIIDMIKDFKGVEGFIVEGYKDNRKFTKNLVREGGEYKYPIKVLFTKFKEIKKECEKNGIRFFCAENRLRWMGENVNCCGVAHLDGFEDSNRLNVTKLFYREHITFSNILDEGEDYKDVYGKAPTNGLVQDTIGSRALMEINKNTDGNLGFYNFLKYYVNNGNFARDYNLEAVGKDNNGNYVFEYKDKTIENYRKEMFKGM